MVWLRHGLGLGKRIGSQLKGESASHMGTVRHQIRNKVITHARNSHHGSRAMQINKLINTQGGGKARISELPFVSHHSVIGSGRNQGWMLERTGDVG